MAILITGGTGFVGQRFIRELQDRPERIWICSRQTRSSSLDLGHPEAQLITWNPTEKPLEIFPERMGGGASVRVVVNLMGESVAGGRWTKEKKHRIRESRVLGTRNLVDGLIQSQQRPEVMISASAIGIYGDRGEEIVTESTPPGDDFLAEVGVDWEAEADRIAVLGTRVVKLRIGIVQGIGGGALKEILPIFRLGGGGKLGSGQQWFSWIHLQDLVRMIVWAMDHSEVSGVFNATAPNPLRNETMTQELANVLHRPAFMRVPPFALKMMLGEFADSLLASQRIVPRAALQAGFIFDFPEYRQAVEDLLQ